MERNRPLSRILIAYHASANVLLLYRRLIASGLEDEGYCANGEARLRSILDVLEAPLRDNPALTPLGQALCQPLMERIHSEDSHARA
jgi:HEXXH motif-containing protein